MPTVYTMERHHQLLHLWQAHSATGLRVVHLDFHCDMRGMLIDRRVGLAYRIRDQFPDLDQGNFLAHAVMEGRIDRLRWVHDDPGGRRDDIGTVKFESDLTALPHRAALAVRNVAGQPLHYEVVPARRWQGVEEDEVLDIDWDYFACLDYPTDSIPGRIASFWETDSGVIPEETYVCYSPEYSHPTRRLFDQFVRDLAGRFAATIVALDPPATNAPPNRRIISGYLPDRVYRTARSAYRRTALALKHRGLY